MSVLRVSIFRSKRVKLVHKLCNIIACKVHPCEKVYGVIMVMFDILFFLLCTKWTLPPPPPPRVAPTPPRSVTSLPIWRRREKFSIKPHLAILILHFRENHSKIYKIRDSLWKTGNKTRIREVIENETIHLHFWTWTNKDW